MLHPVVDVHAYQKPQLHVDCVREPSAPLQLGWTLGHLSLCSVRRVCSRSRSHLDLKYFISSQL